MSATLVEAVGYVKASNTQGGDQFGFAVALSDDGNTLAVGANREASNATGVDGNQFNDSIPNAGAVYVFARDADTGVWAQQAYVKPANTQAPLFGSSYDFGWTVALDTDGDTLAVGAPAEPGASAANPLDQSAQNAGAVYVYTRDGAGTWSHQAYLKASNVGMGDFFGFDVALSDDGNTLAVGARGEGSGDGTEADDSAYAAGAVYVLTRAAGVWTQQDYAEGLCPRGGRQFRRCARAERRRRHAGGRCGGPGGWRGGLCLHAQPRRMDRTGYAHRFESRQRRSVRLRRRAQRRGRRTRRRRARG